MDSFQNAAGDVVGVSPTNPLPVTDSTLAGLLGGYAGAVAITPGEDQTPQRGIGINCTVAGNVVLKLSDDSQYTIPVAVGWSAFPFAVKTVVVAGTTATATYANLK